jgi:pimeloyl-ACP methyl ester carboxylesterase
VRHLKLPIWGLACAASCLAGCSVEYDARRLIEPPPGNAPARVRGIDLESEFAAGDGAKLSYWVIRHRRAGAVAASRPAASSRPDAARGTVLMIHPLLVSKGWFAPLGLKLADAGWDVVLVDVPAHGGSSGQFITWGAKEKVEFRELMAHATATHRLSDRIYAFGASMGGCVAIQYGAADPRCRGVLALAPPTGLRAVAQLMFPWHDQKSLEARIAKAGELGGFNPNDASALAAAARLDCPLFLAHGRLDLVVPYQQSEELFKACKSSKQLTSFRWLDHVTIQTVHDAWIVNELGLLAQRAEEADAARNK